MVFVIESVVLCALFTVMVVPWVLKDPLAWVSDFPPAIQERARELGLVSGEKEKMPPAVIARKVIGCIGAAVLLALLLVYVNGADTFRDGFLISYGLWLVVDWYDALVLDCLWVCHSRRVILPGTEDMAESYRDYWFHIKMSVVGMFLGLPVCLLAGLAVMLLA